MPKFPTFNGSKHTHRFSGRDYNTLSFNEIRAMCISPACVEKQDAPAFIASTYFGHLARNHAEQRERGKFHALVADVDEQSPTIDDVDNAVRSVVGDATRMIYSSSSASADKMKWRIIVPVRDAINGSAFGDTQMAFFEELAQHGIICDFAMARTGQPIYLPNVPPSKRDKKNAPLFYAYRISGKGGLQRVPDTISKRVIISAELKLIAEQQAIDAAKQKVIERKRLIDETGMETVIESFINENDIKDMLLKHGWLPRGINWFASPFSQSKGRSVWAEQQYAVSFTTSDAGLIGRPTKSGWTIYDAWDVFVTCEHNGNQAAAIRAYAETSGYNQRKFAMLMQKWIKS